MRFPRAAFAAVALATTSCSTATAPEQEGGTDVAPAAAAYLTAMLDIMQANSINRLTIKWPEFRDTVFFAAHGAQNIEGTKPAIREALRMLHDGHSQYRSAAGPVTYVPNRTCVTSNPSVPTLPANIGYVKVGATSVSSAADMSAFATNIQNSIRNQDKAGLIGWIVDLRGNGGGNMWPMVAGLGPLIGEGLMGHFVDPLDQVTAWTYEVTAGNGYAVSANSVITTVTGAYLTIQQTPRVAVLVDNLVASSGEATFVAFRGRANTRSFGDKTCGLSTANRGFPLSDGANLILTTSVMADRALRKFGDSIEPDEKVLGSEAPVLAAITWLQQQQASATVP